MSLIIKSNIGDLTKAFKRAGKDFERDIHGALKKSAFVLEAESAKKVPVDTGNLRGRIGVKIGKKRAQITASTKYAEAVHEGTKPHTVSPGAKGFLAFKIGGKWIYTRKAIHHPGTDGKPFFEEAIKSKQRTVENIFVKALNKILNKVKV